MSPRSNRPRRAGRRGPRPDDGPTHLPHRLDAFPRREEVRGREYIVRPVRGDHAVPYRCPGCDQPVAPGTAHVVVWPDDLLMGDGLEERRHWHTGCWRRSSR